MSLQSQQARLATLYLPLFGLLQENVCRLHVKESLVPSHNVRPTPSGNHVRSSLCVYFLVKPKLVTSLCPFC